MLGHLAKILNMIFYVAISISHVTNWYISICLYIAIYYFVYRKLYILYDFRYKFARTKSYSCVIVPTSIYQFVNLVLYD